MSDDAMRYGMIGDDGLTEEERLGKYTGPVSRDYLLPHLRSGVLFHVERALELGEVGIALSRDDKRRVQAWLDEELLRRGEEADLEESGEEAYLALVVTPFVLFRRHEKSRPAQGADGF